VDIGKHVSSLEDQERHIGMTTRNKVDGLLSILSAQGDRLQTVTTLQAVQADDLKTVLDRQERTADRDAGKFNDLSFILTAVANGIRHIEKELGSAGSSAARHSDLVQRQTATHENLQQMWAAVTQMHAKAAQTAEDNYQALRVQMANMATQLTSIERELGREGESESRHQSIIAYLKALQGKIDALPATDQTPTYRG
jgi:dynactin complex subunit